MFNVHVVYTLESQSRNNTQIKSCTGDIKPEAQLPAGADAMAISLFYIAPAADSRETKGH